MPRPPFPRTLIEFQRRFAEPLACRSYLVASRWPEGYRCPRCGCQESTELARSLRWQCGVCRYQASVTAGTVLHRSHVPLTHWFWAAYLVATHTPGMSALQLQKQLGLGSYRTAWTMLHKLRRAMVNAQREPLHGKVEADEVYIGGPEEHLKGGRQLKDKALVVGAVEVRGEGSGRVRLQVVPDASGPSLTGFIKANVEPGAVVLTDGWPSYETLSGMGYVHRPRIQGDPKRAEKLSPRIHRVFGNLQTWLRGTHHGVDNKHLQAYLNEFVFRYNRRRTPMAAFQTLLGLGTLQKPTTYDRLRGADSSA
ncbi:MAG: IS1595 family transposase [Actinomycetota bacterium]